MSSIIQTSPQESISRLVISALRDIVIRGERLKYIIRDLTHKLEFYRNLTEDGQDQTIDFDGDKLVGRVRYQGKRFYVEIRELD